MGFGAGARGSTWSANLILRTLKKCDYQNRYETIGTAANQPLLPAPLVDSVQVEVVATVHVHILLDVDDGEAERLDVLGELLDEVLDQEP